MLKTATLKTAGVSSLLAYCIGFRLASPDILWAKNISLCLCCFCFSGEPDVIYNSISMALNIFYIWLPLFISNPDFSLEFQMCVPTAYSELSMWIAAGLKPHHGFVQNCCFPSRPSFLLLLSVPLLIKEYPHLPAEVNTLESSLIFFLSFTFLIPSICKTN